MNEVMGRVMSPMRGCDIRALRSRQPKAERIGAVPVVDRQVLIYLDQSMTQCILVYLLRNLLSDGQQRKAREKLSVANTEGEDVLGY